MRLVLAPLVPLTQQYRSQKFLVLVTLTSRSLRTKPTRRTGLPSGSLTQQQVKTAITATLSLVDGASTQGAILTTIRTACINRTTIKVGAFTSAIAASAEGVVFDCYVFSNDIAQPLSDGQTVSVTFAPASGGTLTPDWVTLS